MNMASGKGETSAYTEVMLQGACQASHLLGSSRNTRGSLSVEQVVVTILTGQHNCECQASCVACMLIATQC